MDETIARRVLQILAEQAALGIDEMTQESTLEDLGIDSLGVVEAIFAIEEQYDIEVPFNANEPTASEFDISSVGAIIRAVEELVRQRAR